MAPGVVLGSVYFTNKFNAFTDLSFFENKWVVVFREGSDHVGGAAGKIKILTSTGGVDWKVEKTLGVDSVDLRDPKIMIDSVNGSLYVTFFGIDLKAATRGAIRNYFVEYLPENLEDPITEIEETWLNKANYRSWRWTFENSSNYCIAYRISGYTDTTTNLILLNSNHRFDNRRILKNLNFKGQPTEATIRFDAKKRMVMVIRSDEKGFHIGTSDAPYTNFVWEPNNDFTRLASPNFLFYKSILVLTGRDLRDNKFKLFTYDLATHKLTEKIVFKGGYEVGYGGMSYNPDIPSQLWISYYSIENGGSGSNIYLAKVNLDEALN